MSYLKFHQKGDTLSYLKLSRKVKERVFIDDSITMTVLGIQGDRVHLGFSALVHVPIDREEIALRKRQNPTSIRPKPVVFDRVLKRRNPHAVL